MPFKSKAQQRWMFATHPKMARRWAKETPDIKSLPQYVKEAFFNELEKIAAGLDVDDVRYGNAPAEYLEAMSKKEDPLRDWFIRSGEADRIIREAPANSSETTRKDLQMLAKKMSRATAEQVTFARYAEEESNIANLFLDLLKAHGYESTMGEYFGVDSQTEGLLFYLKEKINRPRPYQLAREYGYPIYPLIRSDAMTAAYPSGHALAGFVMGEYYARKFPKIADKLRALGERIAESREVTGIHYPSDTEISRKICATIFKNNLLKAYT